MTDTELATLIQSKNPADRETLEGWLATLPPDEAAEKVDAARKRVFGKAEHVHVVLQMSCSLLLMLFTVPKMARDAGMWGNKPLEDALALAQVVICLPAIVSLPFHHRMTRRKIPFDILLARHGHNEGRNALLYAFTSSLHKKYLPRDGSAEEALAFALTQFAASNEAVPDTQQKQLRTLLKHCLKTKRGQDISEARADLAIAACRVLLTTIDSNNKKAVERVARQAFPEPNRRLVAETAALLLSPPPKIRDERGKPVSAAPAVQAVGRRW